jgi:hypothetical protein
VSAKALDTKLKTLRGLTSELLDELAEDAQAYLNLLARLREAELETEEHGDIEAQLYAKVVSLKIHSAGVQEALDAVTEALPEDA